VDFGSTFTKVAVVDLAAGELIAIADHPTTIRTDLWDGFEACLDLLATAVPGVAALPVLACSSAGGGLRIAVVGNEELVTAEAGRRVALSSGGRVVAVIPGPLTPSGLTELKESRPDVVLLVGGTDGGNAEVLLASARTLAGWAGPVVVAGNVEIRSEVVTLLEAAGTPYVAADNVVPRIGVLAPDSARAAIREMFVSHVIGGKKLSRHPAFLASVKGATPDLVLAAVELLAHGIDESRPGAGDVVVVDVGGATTDVHSVIELDPEDATLGREVVAVVPASRTVEGDLGMRWSATSTVEAGIEHGFVHVDADLVQAAQRRHDDTDFIPTDAAGALDDLALASVATGVALRRHAGRSRVVLGPGGRVVERTGKDLREVDLLVGSGGVLRHAGSAAASVLAAHLVDDEGWQLPEHPRTVIDVDYRLAPAGLLAFDHPEVAYALLRPLLTAPAD
jgi:uncharacterized protein (TIGR01319 family)